MTDKTKTKAAVSEPCPFCEGRWTIICRPANGSQPHVQCRGCNARGPFTAGMTEKQFVAAWNTRAPDPDLLALVEKLVGALEVCDEELYAPDTGCSCHIAPPCKSCIQYGSIREAKDAARAALTEATAMLAERAKS